MSRWGWSCQAANRFLAMNNDSHLLNPADFIIVRKRKKYRFALFANAENCFELADWQSAHRTVLWADRKMVVEMGAGTGLFLVEMATRHPDCTYVAIDVKADRLQKGAREALSRNLRNIYFVRARADQLLEVVPPASVNTLWLTFSDPFPKKRDAKRRLTAPGFLRLYEQALVPSGTLLQKTDNHALFDWSLEQLVANKWQLRELSYDLHDSELPDDYKILTTYERKWLSEGLQTYFVSATCPK